MVWIYVAIAVALIGLGLLIWYCVRLTRKVADLAGEVAVLAGHGGQLVGMLEQIELPENSALTGSSRASDSEADVR